MSLCPNSQFETIVSPIETLCGCLLKYEVPLTAHIVTDIFKTVNVNIPFETISNKVDTILADRSKLAELLERPFAPQKSEAWLQLRKNLLTASDLAQALDEGKFGTSKQLLLDKAGIKKKMFDAECPPLDWGVRFEPIASDIYSRLFNGIKVHDFGLIQHPTFKIFGASPDGITELGHMLEIKCPYKRKPDGQVPRQYWLQIQGQLEVCDLTMCHFIDCVFEEMDQNEYWLYSSEADTKADVHEKLAHEYGIILKFKHKIDGTILYDYLDHNLKSSKVAFIQWRDAKIETRTEYTFLRHCFWKIKSIDIVPVARDTAVWSTLVPRIEAFWNEVVTLRGSLTEQTVDQSPTLNKKKRASAKVDAANSVTKFSFTEDLDDFDY